jgi:hypothetical protein
MINASGCFFVRDSFKFFGENAFELNMIQYFLYRHRLLRLR